MKKIKFKKSIISAALAAVISIVPAQAQYLAPDGITIMPNEETQQFWNTYKYILSDKKIHEHSADNWSFCPEFNNGLLLVYEAVNPCPSGYWDNYVDKNGQLHDLNKGRYQAMYSFSGGLASVKSLNTEKQNYVYNVGYVDTKGNEVIPCNDNWCSFQFTNDNYLTLYYQGAFKNGKTVVIREPDRKPSIFYDDPYTTYYSSHEPEKWYGVEYAYIDTSGNYLTDWKFTQDINEVINLPLYDQDGISLYDRVHGIGSSENLPSPEPEQPEVESTYGQATARIKGYTIDKDYVGKMVIEITNTGNSQPDKGDLFYITYAKFIKGSDIVDAGVYVPYQTILQIPYEVDANATTTLKIPVGFLPNYDQELTEDQIANGWNDMENVESARTILAQAETAEEAEELRTFFMKAHDYGEMGLTYEPDSDGVTILAAPYSSIERAKYLDQKLSVFTSKF